MKKLIWTVALVRITALTSFSQGYVIFSSSTQNISTNGFFPNSGRTQGAGNYYYALFWSSTITSGAPIQGYGSPGGFAGYAFNTPGWNFDSDPTAVASSTATRGRFAATAPNSDGSTTVPGTVGGDQYYFVIVGWSASLGTTLAQMEASLGSTAGYFGQSAVSGPVTVGNGSSIPPSGLMGGLPPTIQAFTLGTIAIPEPGTLALAALGGASLLLFRRKKTN